MNDLYRWTNQSAGAWVDTETMRQELVDDGVLMPDSRLADIAAADLKPVADLVTELRILIEGSPAAFNSFQWASRFRNRVLALEGTDDADQSD